MIPIRTVQEQLDAIDSIMAAEDGLTLEAFRLRRAARQAAYAAKVKANRHYADDFNVDDDDGEEEEHDPLPA